METVRRSNSAHGAHERPPHRQSCQQGQPREVSRADNIEPSGRVVPRFRPLYFPTALLRQPSAWEVTGGRQPMLDARLISIRVEPDRARQEKRDHIRRPV